MSMRALVVVVAVLGVVGCGEGDGEPLDAELEEVPLDEAGTLEQGIVDPWHFTPQYDLVGDVQSTDILYKLRTGNRVAALAYLLSDKGHGRDILVRVSDQTGDARRVHAQVFFTDGTRGTYTAPQNGGQSFTITKPAVNFRLVVGNQVSGKVKAPPLW